MLAGYLPTSRLLNTRFTFNPKLISPSKLILHHTVHSVSTVRTRIGPILFFLLNPDDLNTIFSFSSPQLIDISLFIPHAGNVMLDLNFGLKMASDLTYDEITF